MAFPLHLVMTQRIAIQCFEKGCQVIAKTILKKGTTSSETIPKILGNRKGSCVCVFIFFTFYFCFSLNFGLECSLPWCTHISDLQKGLSAMCLSLTDHYPHSHIIFKK